MEINKIMLLSQLINQLRNNLDIFDKAYRENDKENFDSSKKLILDLQKKISIISKK